MAQATLTYKCPNCDAGLIFNADKQLFSCQFCFSDFTEEELLNSSAAQNAERRIESDNLFADEVEEYHCQSCGAEIIADKTTVAEFCIYCHNPIVLADKVGGFMRPTKLIPFKFGKDDAIKIFNNYIRKKRFLPRDYFLTENVEKIRGVYYPYWVTDADTYSVLNTSARTVRTWRSGDYRYTETNYYAVRREGNIHFEDITNLAMTDEDTAMLEGILPYPSDAYIDFEMPYLHGFYAKKRTLDTDDLSDEVRRSMQGYSSTLLRRTISGYSSVDTGTTSVDIKKAHWEYALMPVWILTYKKKRDKKNKIYTYAMNGYTGKIYGELPVSVPKILALFGSIVALATGLFTLLGGLMLW